jgi:hypothetical protein
MLFQASAGYFIHRSANKPRNDKDDLQATRGEHEFFSTQYKNKN